MNTNTPNSPPTGLIAAAFIAVYLIWGSTYLAIRFAVDTMPPFFMGGLRFLVAGLILYVILRIKGIPNPGPIHWRNAAIVGTLLIGGGNGGVCWAEQQVPSNITALFIGATPVWFALIDWLRPGGVRPQPQTAIGILIGLTGVLLLVSPKTDSPLTPSGTLALFIATFSWASGSLYARYTPKPDNPLMGIALQMIVGAGSLFVAGTLSGEPSRLDWTTFSARSWGALAYLTFIGSLVGFTAYSWLIKVTTPAKLSTYAYINPVIAMFLGWFIAHEILSSTSLWAAAIIIAGVMTILIRRSSKTP